MKFTQHIPGFVSGVDPSVIDFDTPEELLTHPEIVKAATYDGELCGFYMSDNRLLIMTESESWWWVLGYIDKPEEMNLPKWEPKAKPPPQK